MLKHLLKFEWSFYNRKWSFYVMLFAFFAIGFIITLANFSPPNMNKNSPYVLASLIGLLSLATVFSTTLLAAQLLLKEIETKFDAIIYATPLKKVDHLASRFIVLFILSVFSFFLLVVGIVVGLQMPWVNQEQMGSFNLWHYLQPFLFVVIPNIFLCSALVSALAWTTKNKLIIYVGGLLIYVLYMVGSVFSNSPIMAGASPASPEAISWAARLDPFGLASLFEQTTNWSAVERNTHVVELKGNFLINRVLWMSVSVFTLVIAYLKFGFKVSDGKKGKQGLKVPKKQSKQNKQPRPYAIAQQKPGTQKHQWQTLISFTKLDLTTILKGIPFILILIIWTFFLGMEMQGAIDGGIRISSFYAETGIILNTILETLPFFALTVMLFYSSEVLGRSKSVFMAELENSTPLNPSMVFFSKLISLSVITLLLIAYSIFIGVVLQVIYQYPIIDWGLYMSLFYLLGLPIVLCTVLAMGIQVIVNNKYLGLTLASIIILLTNSALGRLIGLRHLLFRFANPMPDIYADMNGFGNYISAFHWRMLYATALAVLIGLVASLLWNRNKSIWNTLKGLRLNLFQKSVLWLSVFVFLLSGGYIFYQTNIANPSVTQKEATDRQQAYEQMYRPYQQFPQPVITNVKTTVDLYPNENNYAVQGQYTLVNKTGVSIDSLLVYIDRRAKLNSVEIPNAEMVKEDLVHRHYWYSLSKPLQPGDSTTMQFQFSSSWSPFNGHTPFNSIIDNGSFMRISRYYPLLGYQPDNEIGNQEERTKRGMPTPTEVPKLESKDTSTYDFIHLDAVVSTSSDQTAVGVGELVGSWSKDERNYFHYKTPIPIEFRFAFSSAKYAVKKEQHKGIQIEVYYHPQHSENVNQLIANAKNTLAYCEDNFGPYPFKVIRFAEVSGFVEGFNATAYPATIFMLENLAFHSDLTKGNDQDVINELAGHELSHQWWGTSQLAPDEREGSRVLVETLAMYTELMLYQKAHGLERAVGTVAMHRGFYLSARSFSKEVPLYKANPDQIHLFYNKGTVIMHQLRWLIGEDSVNKALNSLLLKHAYPKKMPTTIDLMNAFYAVSKVEAHAAIDEMFKQIITHDAKVENVTGIKIKDDRYELTFEASIRKYSEDGNGNKTEVTPDPTIEVALYTEDGAEKIVEYPVSGKRLKEVLTLDKKPVRIVIDPHLRLLDTFSDDNEKDIEDDFDQRK